MVKAGRILVEASLRLTLGHPAHQDPGAAPDAVDNLLGANQGLHPEKMTERLPKGNASGWVVDRHLDMGNSVDFNAHENLFL